MDSNKARCPVDSRDAPFNTRHRDRVARYPECGKGAGPVRIYLLLAYRANDRRKGTRCYILAVARGPFVNTPHGQGPGATDSRALQTGPCGNLRSRIYRVLGARVSALLASRGAA